MKAKLKRQNCGLFINPNERNRAFMELEQRASKFFLDFISTKEYGQHIELFLFKVYVEETINFGRQRDFFEKDLIELSIHIDKESFENAKDEDKFLLLINAMLVLTRYLAQRDPLPKVFQAEQLLQDFQQHIIENSLLLSNSQIQKYFIKPFNSTRFNILITSTAEVKLETLRDDLNELQDFINNKLAGQSFGTSIREFDFGFEIADSTGRMQLSSITANLKLYDHKSQTLTSVKQFDYHVLYNLKSEEQFGLLKRELLDAISELDHMEEKPKGFDRLSFLSTIKSVLDEYEETKGSVWTK